MVDDGAVRANLGALAALYTLGFVNVGTQMLVKGNGAPAAGVLAAMGNTAPAGVADIVAGHGAFIAGNINDFDDVGVVLVPAHSQLDPLLHHGALLVDAAPHGGLLLDNQLGNLGIGVQQPVLKGVAGNLPQHLVLQVLNLGVELSVFNGN